MTAVRFAHKPQPTLVVVAGEDAAVAFARNVAAFIGEERVLRFPERKDYPFAPKRPDARGGRAAYAGGACADEREGRRGGRIGPRSRSVLASRKRERAGSDTVARRGRSG